MNIATKRKIESGLSGIMAGFAAVIVALMPVHAFVSTWLGTVIGPILLWKSWKEVLLTALVPLAVWFCALRPDVARVVWGRAVNKLIAAYVLLHLGLSVVSSASADAVVAGLMMNLRFLAIFVLVQAVVAARPGLARQAKEIAPNWLLWVGVGLAVLAALQVFVLPRDFLVQFGYGPSTIAPYVLVDENPDALRAFATMRGPNTLGAFMLLPIAVGLYMLYRRRRNTLGWVTVALGVIAVYLTSSRSAWLGLLVAVVVLALLIVPRHKVLYWSGRLVVPAVVAGLLVGWAAVNIPSVRLAVFHSSPGDPHLFEGSSEKHWEATRNGIEDVVRHPGGSGPGSAGPASFYNTSGSNLSENYYVQIAQEVGWIGLGLFVAINVLVVRSIVRRSGLLPAALVASFAGISLINFFLHGWADDPTALTWWALAGLVMSDDS